MLGCFAGPVSSPIVRLFLLDVGVQWVACSFAIPLKTEKFYDLTGSLTFIGTAYLSHRWSNQTLRQTIQSNMVLFWALRLGLYLFVRVLKDGRDKRFDRAKESPPLFFAYWTFQGIWVFVTMLPTLLLNAAEVDRPIGAQDYIGWAMWGAGFLTEVVADYQKTAFRRNPDNKGKFINTGLWSVSRHPNYFGEILLWSGLYVSASSVMRKWRYLSVLSPAFVALLITKVSGIPMLEKAGLKKWGELREYQRYLRDTPCLVPFLNKSFFRRGSVRQE